MRKITKEEAGWILSLERCLKKKPKTIELFADGKINIVCSKELDNNRKYPNRSFQPLVRMPYFCEGGDPWV